MYMYIIATGSSYALWIYNCMDYVTYKSGSLIKFAIHLQITITNMIKIKKAMEGERVVECLIVTTESSHLFVLDPESFSVVEQRKVIPTLLSVYYF